MATGGMLRDMKCLLFALSVLLLAGTLSAQSKTPLPPGFDPAKHMLVSEVEPGMKGYGLSVFSGEKIDRFEVEVISILRHFNPRQDVVLIRVAGCNLEHTGAIAGMSGSPVYLLDKAGKYRLIGAFAYGWPMMKDPVAGVQPIEYMLAIPLQEKKDALPAAGQKVALGGSGWSVLDAMMQARKPRPVAAAATAGNTDLTMQMRPLATPLVASGIAAGQLRQLSALFEPLGVVPLQAGGAAGGNTQKTAIAPGSVLAVPLLTGDIDMTAVGTCTEVLGNKVYGFGHPFTGEGPVTLPMCGGQVNGIIANLVTSFKLGTASEASGTLQADHISGIAGQLGEPPLTAPIKLHVSYTDKSFDQTFNFQAAIHPRFTPLLATSAIFASLSSARELPQHNTINYRMRLDFGEGRQLQLANVLTNVDPQMFFMEFNAPVSTIVENPFERLLIKGIEADIQVSGENSDVQILQASAPRLTYRPGEKINLSMALRPFRGADFEQPLDYTMPEDIADGAYQLVISDLPRYLADEQVANPYRFTAGNIKQVFTALNELAALRCDTFYLRLVQNDTGVAVGRAPLPHLPASQRQMLIGSGRADITPVMNTQTRTIASKWVVNGAAQLTIQVSRNPRQINKPAGNAPGIN